MSLLTALVLALAVINLWHLADWNSVRNRVLDGIGLYWLTIVGVAVIAAWYGYILQARGAHALRMKINAANRDRGLALRFGGMSLSATSLGLALVAFRLAQPEARRIAGAGGPDRGIGFFDLMTWLGTFATLAVVISTALVAIWVKRRDDEAQHSAAVVRMRQAWISKVRRTMAGLLAIGQALRAEHELQQSDRDRGREARLLMREADLLLNPMEGHHAVLLAAARSWLHHAGIEEHLRDQKPHPSPQVEASEFEVATTWLVLLTQLVLKIEWIVTSVGRERIEEKAQSLWDEVRNYELKYGVELRRIAAEAMILRKTAASVLVMSETEPSLVASVVASPGSTEPRATG